MQNIILLYNIMGILLSIPIALIYNWLVSKISDIITADNDMKDKIQKSIITSIIAGVIGLAIGFMIFGSKRFKNNIAKYGFILGGAILLIYSVICNWNALEEKPKLFLIVGTLLGVILYSYKYVRSEKKKD